MLDMFTVESEESFGSLTERLGMQIERKGSQRHASEEGANQGFQDIFTIGVEELAGAEDPEVKEVLFPNLIFSISDMR